MRVDMNQISVISDPPPVAEAAQDRRSRRRELMARVFRALDGAGIDYCIPHGHEDLPGPDGSDLDIIVDPAVSPGELRRLLGDRRALPGVEILEARGYLHVLSTSDGEAGVVFDFAPEAALGGAHLLSAREVLANKIRREDFWIPQPDVEFIGLLLRALFKGGLNEARRRRLSLLYELDRACCEKQIFRFAAGPDAELIVAAARGRRWEMLAPQARRLGRAVRARAILRRPLRALRLAGATLANKFDRLVRPSGMRVVLLGPDGAGKSSVAEALRRHPPAVFARSECRGFAPRMFRRLLRREHGPTDQPHALPERSAPASIIRAGYWLLHQLCEHAASRIDLARGSLIVYDRHFVDVLVDQKRYRYGGPRWLLSMIWATLPKPDLILLLDAPAEALHRRKQELGVAETDRQRREYRQLVSGLSNGRVVDAAQPLASVVDQVSRLLVARVASREAERRDLLPGARPLIHEDLDIEVCRDPAQARGLWADLAPDAAATPYQDFAWESAWWRHVAEPGGESLALAGLRRSGELLALLPLTIRSESGVRVARFMGGEHFNLQLPLWREALPAALGALPVETLLRSICKAVAADVIELTHQPRDWNGRPNPFLPAAPDECVSPTFSLPLTGSFAEVSRAQRSARSLQQIRRKRRLLEAAHGEVRFRCARDAASRERAVDAVIRQRGARRDLGGVPSFFDMPGAEAFIRDLAKQPPENAASEAPLRIDLLEVGGEIAATYFGAVRSGVYSCFLNSFDPKFESYSPGEIILHDLVEALCEENMTLLDLGVGAEHYKKCWCNPVPLFEATAALNARGEIYARLKRVRKEAKRIIKDHEALWRAWRTLRRITSCGAASFIRRHQGRKTETRSPGMLPSAPDAERLREIGGSRAEASWKAFERRAEAPEVSRGGRAEQRHEMRC